MNVTSASNISQVYATNKTTASKATSVYDGLVSSQSVDKMDEMKEKYKDVYTPIPETYTKGSEELQTAKILEAYPNYISGPEFLKLVDATYDGEPLELGKVPTQEQIDKQKIAFEAAYEVFGGEEAFTKMQKDVKKIQNDYPVNNWGKNENVHNAKELSRFTNAAIYEGLESGKSLEEAKIDASELMARTMDVDFMKDWFLKSIGEVGGTHEPDPIVYGGNSSSWDLREYGIDGRWEDNNVFENDKAMISELEKKIEQFNFMLNNKDLIEKTNNKLKADSRGQIKTYESKISDKYLPETQIALDIFKNYKIYDSIDVKA